MSRNMLKNGIVMLATFIVLVAVTVLSFSMTSTAWFKENRIVTMGSSDIIRSITQGTSNSLASFKNQDRFDADLHFGEDTKEFEQRFIPGDILYYTFIVTKVEVGVEKEYKVIFEDKTDSEIPAFAYHLRIEPDTIVVAVLKREDSGEDESPNYSIYRTEGGKEFYYPEDGVENTPVYRFTYDKQGGGLLDVEFFLTLPQDIEYVSDEDMTADFLIIVPILYMDNGENQNYEMYDEEITEEQILNELTITGCTLVQQ